MFVRICSAVILTFFLLSSAAQAQLQLQFQPPQTSFRSLPPSKQSEIGPTFTKIAKPTLQCMFEPATNQ
jgi:hypothetical protein